MLTHIFKYKDQEINNYSYFEVNERILTGKGMLYLMKSRWIFLF